MFCSGQADGTTHQLVQLWIKTPFTAHLQYGLLEKKNKGGGASHLGF